VYGRVSLLIELASQPHTTTTNNRSWRVALCPTHIRRFTHAQLLLFGAFKRARTDRQRLAHRLTKLIPGSRCSTAAEQAGLDQAFLVAAVGLALGQRYVAALVEARVEEVVVDVDVEDAVDGGQ